MRSVRLVLVLVLATGCVGQFDREEAARNHREWLLEPEHVTDPVAFHSSDQLEFLDPPGPEPLLGQRHDPDTIPREKPRREPVPLPPARDLEQK